MSKTILEVRDLSLAFTSYVSGLRQHSVEVLKHLNLAVHQGEVYALVGSSGSGKSLLAEALLGILPNNAKIQGNVFFEGKELNEDTTKCLRGREIAYVPQGVSSLDPILKVKHQIFIDAVDEKKKEEAFNTLELSEDIDDYYAFELSGGMARRVLVSTALVTDAKLIVADEPTPGMTRDQARETLTIFRKMADIGKAVLLITHDLDLALEVADTVGVFSDGNLVEEAKTEQFRGAGETLKHPLTKKLWNALPQNEFRDALSSQVVLSESESIKIEESEKHVLSADHISLRYLGNSQPVLHDVSIEISSGEIIGLYGGSGSGKSSLAQVLANQIRPTSGRVLFDDMPVKTGVPHPVQLIYQHPELAINPRWKMKKVLEEVGDIDEELFEAAGIRREWLNRYSYELSGGELQRFCVLRSLIPSTKILICDEISTMLDSYTQAHIWDLVSSYVKKYQLGLLVISHNSFLLERLCTKLISIDEINAHKPDTTSL